jgi:transposase
MSSKRRAPKTYTPEHKKEAVRLAQEISQKRAAEELGVPKGTLAGWCIAAQRGEIDLGRGAQTPQTAMTQAAEIQRLKAANKAMEREIRRLTELNEFLEEASAFFAASRRKSGKTSGLNL